MRDSPLQGAVARSSLGPGVTTMAPSSLRDTVIGSADRHVQGTFGP
ncbi:hypothetical protein I545_0005 [Mycobacterium kansasii 662]|uniref:Uncharacterized protein n=1 Tax=Mycobacterium kansasii 662 TaxID=1299326 RepID=X7ZTJ8_MYCKA|nr:hypothetical protein I545_0005 [Mycobacterium kansasii 662]